MQVHVCELKGIKRNRRMSRVLSVIDVKGFGAVVTCEMKTELD